MDDILNRFLAEAPVAVLVRAALAHLFADTPLDALFDRVAASQEAMNTMANEFASQAARRR